MDSTRDSFCSTMSGVLRVRRRHAVVPRERPNCVRSSACLPRAHSVTFRLRVDKRLRRGLLPAREGRSHALGPPRASAPPTRATTPRPVPVSSTPVLLMDVWMAPPRPPGTTCSVLTTLGPGGPSLHLLQGARPLPLPGAVP